MQLAEVNPYPIGHPQRDSTKTLIGEKGVDHPPHYAAIGQYEPIDVIEDWDLPYHAACALKYIARYRHKGTPEQDLKKAAWYLLRLADRQE